MMENERVVGRRGGNDVCGCEQQLWGGEQMW